MLFNLRGHPKFSNRTMNYTLLRWTASFQILWWTHCRKTA